MSDHGLAIPCAASFTSTWTRSTRRWNSATTPSCGASRWRSAAARKARRRRGGELRSARRSACDRRSRWRARCGCVRSCVIVRPDFAKYRAVVAEGLRHLPDRSRRSSSRCRSTRPISTSPRTRGARRSGQSVAQRLKAEIRAATVAHRVGGRRAEQVPGEDRVGVAEARRPDGDCARARGDSSCSSCRSTRCGASGR